jgi:hypothetical protein
MDADLGSGEWVGVLGFSQGAKIAASLLWAQEEAARRSEWPLTTFKFGIIMAGSPPIVRLTPQKPLALYSRSIGLGNVLSGDLDQEKRIVNTPTVHVHGLQDPGLDNHRMLLKRSFKSETTHLVEWNGGHRLPIKTKDVFAIIDAFVAAVKNIETIRDMLIDGTKPVIEI